MAHTDAGIKRQRKLEKKRAIARNADSKLSLHNKESKKGRKKGKKKSPEDMIAILKLFDQSKCIRDPYEWKSSSFNLSRQRDNFIKWIYCKYPVPSFMFGIFDIENNAYYGARQYLYSRNRNHPLDSLENIAKLVTISKDTKLFFEWFMIAASGKSFYKELSDFFSKKEAHIFLNGKPDLNIYENYWRAKLIAAGASEGLTNICLAKFPNVNNEIISFDYYYNAAKFFARFEAEISKTNFIDVMDYIGSVAAENNNKYSFKGRTFSSIVKAANEWHRQQQLKKFGELNCTFPGAPIQNWAWKDKQRQCTWKIEQLTCSRELYREGKTMRHCVASYSDLCREGRSFIFSLTMHDGVNAPERVITIELDRNMYLIQARGKCNATPSGQASVVFRKWCRENSITSKYGLW